MKYFAVHIADLESEEFLAASNDQIATWLFLHALCSKQLNGGTIPGAADIPERFWNRHGVDYDILLTTSPLWKWNGNDLVLEPYDSDGERVYRSKVQGGKTRAEKRWGSTPKSSPDRSPMKSPIKSADADKIRIDKKREDKKRFIKPSIQEIKSYSLEIQFSIDPEAFFDYYESKGWMIGKNPMKDWKAAVRTWKRNDQKTTSSAPAGTISHGGRTFKV